MTTETAFHYAYYELSESWQPERREQFLLECNQLREACRSLGIHDRDIKELKLSHYILIMDVLKPNTPEFGGVLDECIEFLLSVGLVDHNPVKSWPKSTEKSTSH